MNKYQDINSAYAGYRKNNNYLIAVYAYFSTFQTQSLYPTTIIEMKNMLEKECKEHTTPESIPRPPTCRPPHGNSTAGSVKIAACDHENSICRRR